MPDIVVGPPLNSARRHRPDRLGAFQRLDLGLLVHTEHDRTRRRIQVQPDHVPRMVTGRRIRIPDDLPYTWWG